MKKILIAFLSVALLSSCTSNEKKANKLIKEKLMEYLYYPDSYKSTYTKVDSAFKSIFNDGDILSLADNYKKNLEHAIELERNISHNESEMAINSPMYGIWDEYSKHNYNEAKQNKADNEKELTKTVSEMKYCWESIKNKANNIPEGQFCGWIAHHKFTAKTKIGLDVPGDMYFFINKDFSKCEGVNTEDYNQLVTLIKEILESNSFEDAPRKLQ